MRLTRDVLDFGGDVLCLDYGTTLDLLIMRCGCEATIRAETIRPKKGDAIRRATGEVVRVEDVCSQHRERPPCLACGEWAPDHVAGCMLAQKG